MSKRIIHKVSRGYLLLILSTIWVFVIFSAWDFRQTFVLDIELNRLFFSDYWTVSNYMSWLPLSMEVSRGNIFPLDPLLGQSDSGIGFFPYFSLWFVGLLIALFGTSVTLLIGSTLLPTVSYVFMVLIYRRYLSWRWSISISALGIIGFNSAPFRNFLLDIITEEGWKNIVVISPPDITSFPFPAVSLLSFLVLFYLSIQRTYLSKRRSTILSIAWGLQTQVHLLNAIIGIPFWISFFALNIWRHSRTGWTVLQSRELLTQIGLVLFSCLPLALSVFSQSKDGIILESITGFYDDVGPVDWFLVITYFVIPMITLRLAYLVFRIDPYELIFKFLPVWVLMAVELSLTVLWQAFGIGVSTDLMFSRLGMFFLHLFYFVPTIYCVHRQVDNYTIGVESNIVATKIRTSLKWFFKDASLIYLPIFIIMLSSFSMTLSEKSFQNLQQNGVLLYKESENIFKLLTTGSKSGDVLVGPNNLVNIALFTKGRYGTLWSSRITGNVGLDSAIERFALYARIVGWSEEQFLSFMSPDDVFYESSEVFDLASIAPIPGLGYWLLLNDKKLSSIEYIEFLSNLKNIFSSINVNKKIKEFNVKKIVVYGVPENDFGMNFYRAGKFSIIDFREK